MHVLRRDAAQNLGMLKVQASFLLQCDLSNSALESGAQKTLRQSNAQSSCC